MLSVYCVIAELWFSEVTYARTDACLRSANALRDFRQRMPAIVREDLPDVLELAGQPHLIARGVVGDAVEKGVAYQCCTEFTHGTHVLF
jgi:hypothetical protein